MIKPAQLYRTYWHHRYCLYSQHAVVNNTDCCIALTRGRDTHRGSTFNDSGMDFFCSGPQPDWHPWLQQFKVMLNFYTKLFPRGQRPDLRPIKLLISSDVTYTDSIYRLVNKPMHCTIKWDFLHCAFLLHSLLRQKFPPPSYSCTVHRASGLVVEYIGLVTFTSRVRMSPRSFVSNLDQAANLLRVQANSASCPQRTGCEGLLWLIVAVVCQSAATSRL